MTAADAEKGTTAVDPSLGVALCNYKVPRGNVDRNPGTATCNGG